MGQPLHLEAHSPSSLLLQAVGENPAGVSGVLHADVPVHAHERNGRPDPGIITTLKAHDHDPGLKPRVMRMRTPTSQDHRPLCNPR